jgi:hypothetical protein
MTCGLSARVANFDSNAVGQSLTWNARLVDCIFQCPPHSRLDPRVHHTLGGYGNNLAIDPFEPATWLGLSRSAVFLAAREPERCSGGGTRAVPY